MRTRSHLLVLCFALLAILLPADRPATAHPHVWVTMKVEIVYGANGSVTALRHIWKFDEVFSTFATYGLTKDGRLSQEQLAPLAARYLASLKPYGFFSHARADGQRAAFSDPFDYRLEFEDGVLSLHMNLPLASPVSARKLQIAIYDPTYFVDLSFMKDDEVVLVNAPAICTIELKSPSRPKAVDESFFTSLGAESDWAAQFANAIAVHCP